MIYSNDELYRIRQDLHRIPELAFKEVKTRELLLKLLETTPGLVIHPLAGSTGIVAEYSQGSGPYLLFRADMDALPIRENTGVPFASEHEGMMHACGHDVHMTVLLGLINRVAEERPRRNLLFLFQPAEEGLGGAESVLAEGILQSYAISRAFALHVNGHLPVNTVSSKAGIFFAMTQEFDIRFIGQAAHAAFPENGRNALLGGLDFCRRIHQLISELQGSEQVVFNIGSFSSGSIRNIIPDTCLLQGTHRSLGRHVRELINTEIERLAAAVAAEHRLQYKFDLLCNYDPVVNDEALHKELISACDKLKVEYRESGTYMTGEDFGFYTSQYPGLLFWLGVGEQPHDLHSDKFLPDEKCIPVGISVMHQLLKQVIPQD